MTGHCNHCGEQVCTETAPTLREAAQMALMTLCNSVKPEVGYRRNERHLTPKPHSEILEETIETLRAALAQQDAQSSNPVSSNLALSSEPVASGLAQSGSIKPASNPREWQGLTDVGVREVYGIDLNYKDGDYARFARAIEAKLKEKNS